jgi:hypothetical protein
VTGRKRKRLIVVILNMRRAIDLCGEAIGIAGPLMIVVTGRVTSFFEWSVAAFATALESATNPTKAKVLNVFLNLSSPGY